MHRFSVRRRVIVLAGAAAIGGAALVALPIQVAGASPSGPAPLTYSTSNVPLLNLGTVNVSTIAGTGTPPPSGSPNGSILNSDAQDGFGPGQGNGPALYSGSIGPATTYNVQRDHSGGDLTSFEGISGPGQAAVNGGGDLEPPDQGTCVGPDGHGRPIVMEIINNAFAGYSTSGTQLVATTPTYALFNQSSTAFLSDPRCMYDSTTHRWFFTEFVVGGVGAGNTELSPSVQFIAVSQTSDPQGNYTVFGIDTTDITNAGCPCFGDYDMIGADANGFYITTNEFSSALPNYNGVNIYGISKLGLEFAADGAPVPSVVRYNITADAFGSGPYHISPASTPQGGSFADNSEYFVETNSNALTDNHLLVYSLSNTRSLNFGGTPSLSSTLITSEPYAFPPNVSQEAGTLPLGSTVGATSPSQLDTDFDAVQEVTYTNGGLYGEFSTGLGSPSAPTSGIAWFKLDASRAPWGVKASVDRQGYVSSSSAGLLYPDIVVDGNGSGYLDFSLAGASNYPSTADVRFNPSGPVGAINITGAGTAPEDGFTCYPAFVGTSSCRWGDYSGGQYFNGRWYMMGEYVPPSARDHYTNWGTFIWSRSI